MEFRMKISVLTCAVLLMGGTGLKAGLPVLEALGLIESGNNDRAIGKDGEVSRYQILPAVWRKHTESRGYGDKATAGVVAQRHLEFLQSRFRVHTGRDPSDFDLYVMWNAGVSYYKRVGFNARRVHPIIRERAGRFVNLREMPQQASASTPSRLLAVGTLPNGH